MKFRWKLLVENKKTKEIPAPSHKIPPTFHFPAMVFLLLAFYISRFRCFADAGNFRLEDRETGSTSSACNSIEQSAGAIKRGSKGVNVWWVTKKKTGIDFAINFACNFDAIWIRFPSSYQIGEKSNGHISPAIIMFHQKYFLGITFGRDLHIYLVASNSGQTYNLCIYLLRIYQRSTSRFQVEREAFAFEDNAFIWNISGAFAFVNDWRWRILQHENSHNRIQLFFWCSKNSWYTQYFFCALCFAPHIFMINFHIVIYLETENKKFSCFAAFFLYSFPEARPKINFLFMVRNVMVFGQIRLIPRKPTSKPTPHI